MSSPDFGDFDGSHLLRVRDAHRLPDLIVSRAAALAAGPVALYVVDLEGSSLLLLGGGGVGLPDRVDAPLAIGTELPVEAVEALRDLVSRSAPGVKIVPLVVRDRALGVLACAGAVTSELETFAGEAALALELAAGYTDVVHAARRRRPVLPAAEIQQNLLPPRIATLSGYAVAGGVLPGYEIGGDFFDYADNREGVWAVVADAMGKGNSAAAVSSMALGALRAARRSGATLVEAAELIHETILSIPGDSYVTALLVLLQPDRSVTYIACGHPPPLQIGADGEVRELPGTQTHPLGMLTLKPAPMAARTILEPGEQLVLYSDGVTERRLGHNRRLGLDGVMATLSEKRPRVPTATVRALHSVVQQSSSEPLNDDATVLAVAPVIG